MGKNKKRKFSVHKVRNRQLDKNENLWRIEIVDKETQNYETAKT